LFCRIRKFDQRESSKRELIFAAILQLGIECFDQRESSKRELSFAAISQFGEKKSHKLRG
jgi:hypothetical protein